MIKNARIIISITATIAILAASLLIVTKMNVDDAVAVVNPPDASHNTMTLYAYVKPGEKVYAKVKKLNDIDDPKNLTWRARVFNPAGQQKGETVNWTESTANGTDATIVNYLTAGSTEGGIWSIVFEKTGGTGNFLYYWDVNVQNSSNVTQTARVFTEAYQNRVAGGASKQIDLNLWAVNNTGHVYQINMTRFNGILSTIRVDSRGVSDGTTCLPLYKSMPASANVRVNCGTPYRIFFENPLNETLPEGLQPSRDGQKYVKPALMTAESTISKGLSFAPESVNSLKGRFNVTFNTRFSGNYFIKIDTNNDGDYTDSVDVSIPASTDGGAETIQWDGKNGQGTLLTKRAFKAQVFYEKYGEMHLVRTDVEGSAGGITLKALNGVTSGRNPAWLNWDDTEIAKRTNVTTTPLVVGTNVDSTNGVHGWAFQDAAGDEWGNNAFIDDWTFVAENYAPSTVSVTADDSVLKTSANTSLRRTIKENSGPVDGKLNVGDTVTYAITVNNTGNSTINTTTVTWARNNQVINLGSIAAGASKTATFIHTVTQEDFDSQTSVWDSFMSSWHDVDNTKYSRANAANFDVSVATPTADFKKKVKSFNDRNGNGILDRGDGLVYEFIVENTGKVTLTNVKIDDPLITNAGGSITIDNDTVNVNSTRTYTSSEYILTQENVDEGFVINEATLTANDNKIELVAVSDTKSAENDVTLPEISNPHLELSISKEPSTPLTFPLYENTPITWNYIVTNIGNVTTGGIKVTDDQGVIVSCPKTFLAPEESMTCTGTGPITYN